MTAMRFRHVRDENLLSSIKTNVTVSAIVGSMEDHREKTQQKPNWCMFIKEPGKEIIQALKSHAGASEG